MRHLKLALAAVCCLVFAAPAKAQVFDFEEQTPGDFPSITSTKDGETVTIFRLSGDDTSIVDLTLVGVPPSWGTRQFLVFLGADTTPDLVANFSAPVDFVSFQFGDYNEDDDNALLTAYSGPDGTGSVLGTDTLFYPVSMNIGTMGDSAVATLSITAAGIQSILFTTTGEFVDSVYWDNLTVRAGAPVPEPGTLALLAGLSVSGLGLLRRRR